MQAAFQRLPRVFFFQEFFFSILAGKASDYSDQEQLTFVLSFVSKVGEIREEFFGFLHCELGLSEKALAETILTEILL